MIYVLLLLMSALSFAKYTNESELSTISAGGNSQLESYLAKTINSFEEGIHIYRVGGHYTYGEAGDNVSARDWDLLNKYETMFSEHMAFTLGELVEGYRFQGIKARYNSDAGIKYYFIKRDVENFFSEFGYRYTIEDRYRPETNQYENKLRFLTEFNKIVSETFQYRLWAEYVPNLTDRRDYIFTYEASITSILNSVFSLKVAYKGIYDQIPAIIGNKNYDYTYTTSLVTKF
jgi:hypothetical protein